MKQHETSAEYEQFKDAARKIFTANLQAVKDQMEHDRQSRALENEPEAHEDINDN